MQFKLMKNIYIFATFDTKPKNCSKRIYMGFQPLIQAIQMFKMRSLKCIRLDECLLYHFIDNNMDIRDFQGLTKYKLIIPSIYISSWIAMLFGPVFTDVLYQRICIFFLIYLDLKVIILFCTITFVLFKNHHLLKRVQKKTMPGEDTNRDYLDTSEEIYYGFILPNFKEDVEMMAETLDILAAHVRAKDRYLIFLAMECHEEGSELKGEELKRRYGEKFKMVEFTRHQIREHEQKGKASNVSWCAEHLEPFLEKAIINPDSVFLTILDADSWAPNLYFDVLEEHVIKNYENRHTFIYQPPQIFTRNNLDVPVFTRVYDMMHSFAHCSNLYSILDLTFPLSNYTLSYNLVKRIGFWDTCPDAIGEDFHTTQKAYWKTQGGISTVPIYVPFNQVNISTGNGYIEDVKARFWQAERHAQGVADVAYEFKMLFSSKFKPMNLAVWYQIFQTFSLPAIVPWVFISLTLQTNIMFRGVAEPPELIDPLLFSILFDILSIGSTVGYFFYEIMKRRSNKILYGLENESLLRLFEYPLLFVVNLFSMSVPTFVIAAFSTLLGKREYIVAEKKNTTTRK